MIEEVSEHSFHGELTNCCCFLISNLVVVINYIGAAKVTK